MSLLETKSAGRAWHWAYTGAGVCLGRVAHMPSPIYAQPHFHFRRPRVRSLCTLIRTASRQKPDAMIAATHAVWLNAVIGWPGLVGTG